MLGRLKMQHRNIRCICRDTVAYKFLRESLVRRGVQRPCGHESVEIIDVLL